MTLLEAIKTGRPFKRQSESSWCVIYKDNIVMESNVSHNRYTRYLEKESDLFCKDFHIKNVEIPSWIMEER